MENIKQEKGDVHWACFLTSSQSGALSGHMCSRRVHGCVPFVLIVCVLVGGDFVSTTCNTHEVFDVHRGTEQRCPPAGW